MSNINNIQLFKGECLELMKTITDKSIDMILCDLPYGTTACKWDTIIPFKPLWEQYERIIKDDGAIVLFGSQPFTSELIHSNLKLFKYCWVWNKKKAGNIFLAEYQPMKIHEDIIVFSKNTHKYYPIKTPRDKIKRSKNYGTGEAMGGNREKENKVYEYTDKNPVSIIEVSNANQKGKLHPTQKPVELMEYLVKTYTKEEEIVLDNCMGSGSTGIACINTNRNFIGIELDDKYFEIACNRISDYIEQNDLEYIIDVDNN